VDDAEAVLAAARQLAGAPAVGAADRLEAVLHPLLRRGAAPEPRTAAGATVR
jgi:hypothetical protein